MCLGNRNKPKAQGRAVLSSAAMSCSAAPDILQAFVFAVSMCAPSVCPAPRSLGKVYLVLCFCALPEQALH